LTANWYDRYTEVRAKRGANKDVFYARYIGKINRPKSNGIERMTRFFLSNLSLLFSSSLFSSLAIGREINNFQTLPFSQHSSPFHSDPNSIHYTLCPSTSIIVTAYPYPIFKPITCSLNNCNCLSSLYVFKAYIKGRRRVLYSISIVLIFLF
jgi:hypothetical protein